MFCKFSTCTEIVKQGLFCESHKPTFCLYIHIRSGVKCRKETFHPSGLCHKHFTLAKKVVLAKKTTWEKLFHNKRIKTLIQE